MSQVSSTSSSTSGASSSSATSAISQLDIDSFLDLMIAELQNQDPLNPLENDQLLAQISQIREVGATDKLTETLESVLLGQNISSATNLIGADVLAMTDDGERVTGNVQAVTIDGGEAQLELAVAPTGTASSTEGKVEEGDYVYEVVWEGSDGNEYSFQVGVSTASLEDFEGSIQVNNLPETKGVKRIYRTDSSGSGDKKLIGTTASGTTSTFTDTTSSSARGKTLDTTPQKLTLASKVTVSLKNVAEITPPSS
ncbi:flagellar hook assembly protein FlgD [Aeoliella mucimassa]|uniref:Basal-body rod modification protein FlgD n=1 Tax=Aeoliella mucimassa TaxID=2527972 RepID=A0A518AKV4_9BACT|nr:flagellar hook capping FlgD N-terminal domain-containing protein [Aeoliella mucimassa]QDU55314.1 Basal-body rod modification protein FlgD [Aeoliella mucimassa]